MEDLGAWENDIRTQATWKSFFTYSRIQLWRSFLIHVGEEALSLNLMPNFGLVRKILLVNFLNHLIENIWIRFMFPYAQLPFPKEAKQNTIEVTKETNAKLPHHKGHVLTHPLENKMPFVHYIIKLWGCNCIVGDDKNLNGRTWGHSMLKPKPKLM